MFEHFAARQDPRIQASYIFAAERGGALVVDVASHEELNDVIATLPAARLLAFEVHALMSMQHALQSITNLQQALASQMGQRPS